MRIIAKIFLVIGMIMVHTAIVAQSGQKLWYKSAAANWNEALPIGNGRLGAMIFGNVKDELIQLNEGTLWSGGPANTNPNPLAPMVLQELRAALAAGDYKKAENLAKKMQGPFTESYEPLGDLHIRQVISGEPEAYYRDLDLSNAIATTRFKINGVEFTREQFISFPQQVMVVYLTASEAKALSFTIDASSPLFSSVKSSASEEIVLAG